MIHQIQTDGIVCEHWHGLMEQQEHHEAIVHWVAGEEPYRWTWGALRRATSFYASRLKDLGVGKGEVCALILRHNRNCYPIYMAISFIGALPSVLAYPNARLHPQKFREGLQGMAHRSGLSWILTEIDLESTVRPLVSNTGSTIRGIFFPLEWGDDELVGKLEHPSETATHEPCLLQHSSGTTGLQKAVVLSHRAVLEHVRRYGDAIHASADDRIVSWLPLYHDMGLIAAFYLPLTLGIPLIQLDPFEWVSAPIILLEAIAREKGTLCWLPNFAYILMADRVRTEDLDCIRLDSVRLFVNCSEPIRRDSHERFFSRFEPFGLKREALGASYAMAETTFAVTQTTPGKEARCVAVSREELAKGQVRVVKHDDGGGRLCVSSGLLISGCDLQIVDEVGEDLPSDRVGEITVRSVSLFDGYRNNAEKTNEVLRDGWYYTGDYGFAIEGEYYVIGRKKDIIIVAGKNIYPEDIEDVVGQVTDVLPGRVIAFGMDDPDTGTEQICVVAETPLFSADEAEKRALRTRIKASGMTIDITIARVYLAPPRWLIKSSAGKPSRSANKDRALTELHFLG
ncbi:MAG: AMP-binding protein [Syntrophales bacterium LBB04]|nr:AMP-binding protein [Syntrophales bacterium LBB04]